MLRTLVLFTAIVAIEVSGLRVVDRLEDLEGADGMFRNEPDHKSKSSFLQLNLEGKTSVDALVQSLPTSPEEVTELLQTEAPQEVLNGLKLVHNFLGGMITGDAYEKQVASNNDCQQCLTRADNAFNCGVTHTQLCDSYTSYKQIRDDWLIEQQAANCPDTKSICRHFSLREDASLPASPASGSDFGYLTQHTSTATHNNIISVVDYVATVTGGARDGKKSFVYKSFTSNTFATDANIGTELETWRDECFNDNSPTVNGWISFYDALHDLDAKCEVVKQCRLNRAGASNPCTALNTCFGTDGPTNANGDSTRTGSGGHQEQHDDVCNRIKKVDEMVLRVKCLVGDSVGAGLQADADCPAASFDWDHNNRSTAVADANLNAGEHYTNLTCGTIVSCKTPVPPCTPGNPTSLSCPGTDAHIASLLAGLPNFASASDSVDNDCDATNTAVTAASVGAMPADWQCAYTDSYPTNYDSITSDGTGISTTMFAGRCATITLAPHPYRPYQVSSGGTSLN